MANVFQQANEYSNVRAKNEFNFPSTVPNYGKNKLNFNLSVNKTKVQINAMPKNEINFKNNKNSQSLNFTLPRYKNGDRDLNLIINEFKPPSQRNTQKYNSHENSVSDKNNFNILQRLNQLNTHNIAPSMDFETYSTKFDDQATKQKRQDVLQKNVQNFFKPKVIAITAQGPIEFVGDIFKEDLETTTKTGSLAEPTEQIQEKKSSSSKSIWRNAGFNLAKQFLNASITYAGNQYLPDLISSTIPGLGGSEAKIIAHTVLPLLLSTVSFVFDNETVTMSAEQQEEFKTGVKVGYVSSFVSATADVLTGGVASAGIIRTAFDSAIKSNVTNILIAAISKNEHGSKNDIYTKYVRERKRERAAGEVNVDDFDDSKKSLTLGLLASSLTAFSLSKFGFGADKSFLPSIEASKITVQAAARLARESAQLLFEKSGIDANPINKKLQLAKNKLEYLFTLEILEKKFGREFISKFAKNTSIDALKTSTIEVLTKNILKNDFI
jgi:hypothetical protein